MLFGVEYFAINILYIVDSDGIKVTNINDIIITIPHIVAGFLNPSQSKVQPLSQCIPIITNIIKPAPTQKKT